MEGILKDYYVTPCGRVYSKKTKKWLVPVRNKGNGYDYVNLYAGTRKYKKFAPIHRLVAEAWIPNPNGYEVVNHKDENKNNNKVDNLEWCTRTYNIVYSWGQPVLDETTGKQYPSIRAAAKDVGCHEQQLWQILNHYKGKTAKGHTFKFIKEKIKNYG